MTTKSGRFIYLQAVTMIDPTTGWMEIRTVPSDRADLVANQVELAWLTRFPLPNKVIVDGGNEFLAKFREMIINDYGINSKTNYLQESPSERNIRKSAPNNW